MDSLIQKLGGETKRVVHRFKVPASIPGEVREIGLVELTAEDELRVEQRCKGASDKRAAELVKSAICEVNGKAVSVMDGSVHNVWNELPAKVRTLVNSAWLRLHMASDEELEGFFASRTTSI